MVRNGPGGHILVPQCRIGRQSKEKMAMDCHHLLVMGQNFFPRYQNEYPLRSMRERCPVPCEKSGTAYLFQCISFPLSEGNQVCV